MARKQGLQSENLGFELHPGPLHDLKVHRGPLGDLESHLGPLRDLGIHLGPLYDLDHVTSFLGASVHL